MSMHELIQDLFFSAKYGVECAVLMRLRNEFDYLPPSLPATSIASPFSVFTETRHNITFDESPWHLSTVTPSPHLGY